MRLRVLRRYTVVEGLVLAMLALGLPTAGVSAPTQLTSHAGDDTEAAWAGKPGDRRPPPAQGPVTSPAS
jgi:hypothetical protein